MFGDVHGRVALMLTLARRWQQASGCRLDGILQVGDMGAFPDHKRLDDATRKYCAHDPDELGFLPFLSRSAEAEALLAPDTAPPIAFCRGNHEDFAYLEPMREPRALDPYGKLWYIPDRCALDWAQFGGERFRIAAFGGAAPLDAPTGRGRRARAVRRKAARHATTGMQPRFTPADVEAARHARLGVVDVLLTHSGPMNPSWSGGSPLLARIASWWSPRVHLFGHHHQVVGPISTPHGLLVGLEHLSFGPSGLLRAGAWGILSIDEASVDFRWMEREEVPWLAGASRSQWRSLLAP